MPKAKGIYILGAQNYERCYSEDDRQAIAQLVDIVAEPQTADGIRENWPLVQETEIIFSSWGGPQIDTEFLVHAPALKAVFYAAGSIRNIVTDAFWDRDISICSAWGANAVPVAEYTLSQILWGLKLGHHYARRTSKEQWWDKRLTVFGGYGSTVGIVSLGMIGRRVCRLLQPFDVRIIAYDPFIAAADAAELGVELVDLEALFENAAVVSLHTPNLPETRGMIKGCHFARMQKNATFINTARGAVVNEPEMIEVLLERPDLQAVLDVTSPEPPVEGSPLYSLDNVVLTPHIAGSMDAECRRMGNYMRQELERYLAGDPLQWQVTREMAAKMA